MTSKMLRNSNKIIGINHIYGNVNPKKLLMKIKYIYNENVLNQYEQIFPQFYPK